VQIGAVSDFGRELLAHLLVVVDEDNERLMIEPCPKRPDELLFIGLVGIASI
jgi:hypothetical protein